MKAERAKTARRASALGAFAAMVTLAAAPAARAHGDRVAIDELAGSWSLPILPLAIAAVLTLLVVQAIVRLRRRGRSDLAPWSRLALFLIAVAVGLGALVSPLDAAGEEYLLSAHMLQHVLIADVAPALGVLAIRGPLVFFLLPAPVLGPIARARAVRRTLGLLVRPWFAALAWSATIAIWHVPGIYESTFDNALLHDLEHTLFVLVGVLVWTALIAPAGHARSRAARIGLAVYLLAAGQILSELYLFARTPLYGAYASQDERLFGILPLTDQQYAGVVMMVEQVVMIGSFLLFLFMSEDQKQRAELAEEEAGAQTARRELDAET